MLRSILAIVAGFVFVAVLSLGGDAGLRAISPEVYDLSGRTDNVPMLIATILSVGVFAVAGCYLTARLAPRRPMLHALVLGVVGLALNIAGTILLWDSAPAWYHVVSLLLVMPYAWMGGRVRELELAHGSESSAAAAKVDVAM